MRSPTARDVFRPLVGSVVWAVERGYGTFLTLEFGKPHQIVREPTAARRSAGAKVRAALSRRRVVIVGDWHLLILFADWKVSVGGGEVTNKTRRSQAAERRLALLDGQRLQSVRVQRSPLSHELLFDQGGRVQIWCRNAIDDDRYSLHRWRGEIVTWCADGSIEVTPSARRIATT